MIVCSCNVISDKEIKCIVNSGTCPRTPGAVYKCLGCSPNCGRCIATLRTIINEALAEISAGGTSGQTGHEMLASGELDIDSLCPM